MNVGKGQTLPLNALKV